MRYRILPAVLFSILIMSGVRPAKAEEITLLQALQEGEKSSPSLAEARLRQNAAKEGITAARAGYLPTLDFSAIGVDGNPGAFSMLNVDSNLSAVNRSGYGAGLSLRQNLFDFGRTSSAVESAKATQALEKNREGVSRAEVGSEILHTFIECAYMKAQQSDLTFTAEQAQIVARETDKYVRSGQRSIIERYLVEAQEREANGLAAEIGARLTAVEGRLALQLGRDQSHVPTCPSLMTEDGDFQKLLARRSHSPWLDVSQAQTDVAKSREERAHAEARPILLGIASGSYFDNKMLNEKWIYSAGVGVTIPIFSGFSLESNIHRTAAETQAQEAAFEYARQKIDAQNLRFQEEIDAMHVRLSSLNGELKENEEAYQLAKKRYFSLQGTMVDLREALRNLDRTRLEMDTAQRDLLLAEGDYALANGATTVEQ